MMNIYEVVIKPVVSMRVKAETQQEASRLAMADWDAQVTQMMQSRVSVVHISQISTPAAVVVTENGRSLRCEHCGEPLQDDNRFEFEMPLSGGNPYPGTITVCDKSLCQSWAQEWAMADDYDDTQD